jgi:uncharacterized protein (DUF2235 family)
VPGDKIYIFGFSRGAFAARALTGLISYAGLLKSDCLEFAEDAWNFFTDANYKKDFAATRAKITHSAVRVEFLGVWDTVAGPYKKKQLLKKYRFKDLSLDGIVKSCVHVISIDDQRRA